MPKAKTQLNIIKPLLGVTEMADGDLLARLNAIHNGLSNNPAFPNPPIDMPAFKGLSTPIRRLQPPLSMAERMPSRSATNAAPTPSS